MSCTIFVHNSSSLTWRVMTQHYALQATTSTTTDCSVHNAFDISPLAKQWYIHTLPMMMIIIIISTKCLTMDGCTYIHSYLHNFISKQNKSPPSSQDHSSQSLRVDTVFSQVSIDSLSLKDFVPSSSSSLGHAHLWLMSPPCQPYTRLGKQLDTQDPRAKGLLHLASLLSELPTPPLYVFLENVQGFEVRSKGPLGLVLLQGPKDLGPYSKVRRTLISPFENRQGPLDLLK